MKAHFIAFSILFISVAILGGAKPFADKKSDQNIAIGRRAFDEVYSKGNLAAVDELYASDFVDDSPGGGTGAKVIKDAVTEFHQALPDVHVDIEDAFASGDRVVLRYTARGTQTGELMGVPPTGKKMTVRGITIFQIANGKIHREWTEYDRLGIVRQLGLLPSN